MKRYRSLGYYPVGTSQPERENLRRRAIIPSGPPPGPCPRDLGKAWRCCRYHARWCDILRAALGSPPNPRKVELSPCHTRKGQKTHELRLLRTGGGL